LVIVTDISQDCTASTIRVKHSLKGNLLTLKGNLLTLKMEALRSAETSVTASPYNVNIPESLDIQEHSCENPKNKSDMFVITVNPYQ